MIAEFGKFVAVQMGEYLFNQLYYIQYIYCIYIMFVDNLLPNKTEARLNGRKSKSHIHIQLQSEGRLRRKHERQHYV